MCSRPCKGTLNPVWKREYMEVRLQGGTMSADGEYDNPDAPWSTLRLEIWDRDAFSADDFIGQVSVPLRPLTLTLTLTLTLAPTLTLTIALALNPSPKP